eukprot:scaffold1238_cov231-Prasinococcus_capsulatus_cf.AAC.1
MHHAPRAARCRGAGAQARRRARHGRRRRRRRCLGGAALLTGTCARARAACCCGWSATVRVRREARAACCTPRRAPRVGVVARGAARSARGARDAPMAHHLRRR